MFVQVKRRPGVCAFTFSTLPMVILKVLILQIVALSIYNTKDKVHTCSKKIVYFCLPSLDIMVYISVHNLVKFLLLLIHIFPYVCFRPSCRFPNIFPCKDRISIALRSHVVYQFTCQCCSALYVGQTRRHIHTRISEHMKVSPLTGKKRSIPTMSSILAPKHMQKHPVSSSDFKILSCTSEWDLLIGESLLISQLNPVLGSP